MHPSDLGGYFALLLPSLLACLLMSCQTLPSPSTPPVLPPDLSVAIPVECRQIIAVNAPSTASTQGHLWVLESPALEPPSSTNWYVVLGPFPVTLGRNGLALGHGRTSLSNNSSITRLKREGDQCAPIGVFRVPFAFGSQSTASTSLPYHHMTPHHAGVDDPSSRFYNQIIDSREVTPDWNSAESMLPSGGGYEFGLVVDHNPHRIPGAGSCIFLHLWLNPGEPTSGCTAMSRETMQLLFQHLSPQAHPHLVQWATHP